MTRTRVRRRRVGAAVVSVGILGAALSSFADRGGAEPHRAVGYGTYVVKPGDTLWAIARRAGAPGEDPRVLIDAIDRTNELGANLVPGQSLVIPAGG